ncbi:amidase signature domain-containing protein [Bipolaris maydis]|nr:amidase signature domain-containing protein [Bipolaris maydis]KAJ6202339.1 amidase signature domain-containing protein [Bipolaris maydis]
MGKFEMPTKRQMTAPFQSKDAFVDFLRAPRVNDGHVAIGDEKWSNKDLEPTPVEQRTWTWYSLPLYWFSNKFSLVGWNTGSSLVAVGLTWQTSFASACVGALLAAIVVVLMARPGAKYHIGFPVLARSVMGMYGSYFFVFIRAIVCIIWYGIQTFYAGNLLSVMLRCIFGSSWETLPNTLSPGAAVTSKQLLTFFMAWLMQFPFMWVHPTRIHYVFTVKGIIMPVAAFAVFGWCMANGGGLNSMDLAHETSKASSSIPLGWSIMAGINTIFGALSPMLVNQPDLARYCKKPRDAGYLQGVSVFVSAIIVFFLGMASTTSMQSVYGVAYWNIWDLFDAILDHHFGAGARAAIFFASLAFYFGVFATNFGANSIPFGSDMTGLFPKWLTIRRGQILCALLGIAVQPWQLMANASAFLSFLGSYNIFMAPLCAVLIVDYFIVRKGNIHVPSCYDGRKTSLYWFWSGINWCGVVAWILGTTMGIPGLIGQYQPQIISMAAQNMYRMGWILTFTTAATVYYVTFLFIKPRVFPVGRESTPFEWEWLGNDGREGFFEGEGDRGEIYVAATPPMTDAGDDIEVGGKSLKMSPELYQLTATEVAKKIQQGEVTVEEYAKSLLKRIEARDEVVKAWAYLNPEHVIEQAKALDAVPKDERGPLHDMPTQFNSPIYANDAPKVDAGSIAVLRKSGALIFGKTTTTEFAATTAGPKTCNPHDSNRTPGGSSSGSGAAVGDFQAPIGLGTQTGGSTIRPGSYNGIYALKPTWNSITREGQKIYSLILDTLGLYARSVADLELLADTFAIHDDAPVPSDFTVKGAKFAVLKTMVWPQVGPGTAAALDKAVSLLRVHGAEVEEVSLPEHLNDLPSWHATVLNSDGRTAFLPEYTVAKDRISEQLVGHVENSKKITRKAQLEAFDKIAAARPVVDELLEKYAAVLTPSVPDEAPLGIEKTGSAAFCLIWTALHTPVVNVPGFKGQNGMPIGISLVAPRYYDRRLLAVSKEVGKIFEAEGGWQRSV